MQVIGAFETIAPGTQNGNHGAQLVQSLNGKPTKQSCRLFGLCIWGSNLQSTCLHRDQTDLVGHHVMHLPGQSRALDGEDLAQ
ncbi:hypothetical protein MMX123_02756 [Microbacterium sp. MM2322]